MVYQKGIEPPTHSLGKWGDIMQQTINIQELENALNKYGDIVLTKNSKNDVIIMSISEYKRKLKDNELSKKLEKAEQQIKDGKTVKATTVFRELEEKYGF